MYIGRAYSVSDPGEIETYAMDFVNDMTPGDSILTTVWTCSVQSGTDPNPSARIVGPAWIYSPTATAQVIGGGIAGVTYILQAIVTTAMGATLSLFSYATVEFVA